MITEKLENLLQEWQQEAAIHESDILSPLLSQRERLDAMVAHGLLHKCIRELQSLLNEATVTAKGQEDLSE